MDGTLGGFTSRLLRELKLAPATASTEANGPAQEWSLADDPFSLAELIRDATDEVAFRTECLYGQRATALTAGQADYCLPDFFKVKGVYRGVTADGTRIPLSLYDTPQQFDRLTGKRENRNLPGLPILAYFSGPNGVTLWAVPDASVAAANTLVFEGYRKPGQFWKYDPDTLAGIAFAPDHYCPLPVWTHEAVYRCAKYKAAQSDERAWVVRNVVLWKAEYDGRGGELGRVEAAAATHHRTAAHRAVNGYDHRACRY